MSSMPCQLWTGREGAARCASWALILFSMLLSYSCFPCIIMYRSLHMLYSIS